MRLGRSVLAAAVLLLLSVGLYRWLSPMGRRAAPVAPPPPASQPVPTPPPKVPSAPPVLPVPAPKPVPKAVPKAQAKAAVRKAMAPVTPPPLARPVPVPAPPPRPAVPPPSPAPPPLQEWKGKDTAVTHSGQVVIKNDHQWIQFWGEHHPHEAAPEVDFSKNMVIGVFPGSRPADAFEVQIVDTRTESNTLWVYYREQLPPLGTVAVNVTVYPYDLKEIPRTTLPVKFKMLEPKQP